MKSSQWNLIATAAVVLILLHTCMIQLAEAECLYLYTKQPPSWISCDPTTYNKYDTNFILPCTVLVDATSAERDVNVEWYYADFSRRYKYLLATVDFPPIGPTDDNVVPLATLLEVQAGEYGYYYCQAVVEGGSGLLESNALLVQDSYYYPGIQMCSSTEPIRSSLPARCAETRPSMFNSTPYNLTYEPIKVQAQVVDVIDSTRPSRTTTAYTLLEDCQYQFRTEPPSLLTCDPYTGGGLPKFICELFLDTTVLPPRQLHVVWYYEAPGSNPVTLLLFEYIPEVGRTLLRTELIVENFQPGYYYCSIIEVGETLASSTRTQWSVPGSYGGLPPCSTQGGQYQLGVPSTTCAKEVPDTGPFQFVTQVFETMQDATADVQRLLSPSFSGVPAHASTPTPIPTHTPSAVPPPAGSNAGNNSLLWIIIAPAVAVTALMVLLTLIITVIFWRIKRGKKTSKAGTRDSLRPLNREIQVRNATTNAMGHDETVHTPTQEEHYYSHPQWPDSPTTDSAYTSSDYATYSYPDSGYSMASGQNLDHTHGGSYETLYQEGYVNDSYSETESRRIEQQASLSDTTGVPPYLVVLPPTPQHETDNKYTGLDAATVDSPHRYTSLGKNRTGAGQQTLAASKEGRKYDVPNREVSQVNTNPTGPRESQTTSFSLPQVTGATDNCWVKKLTKTAEQRANSPQPNHGYVNTRNIERKRAVGSAELESQSDVEVKFGGSKKPFKTRYQCLIGRDYATTYATALQGNTAQQLQKDTAK